MKAKHRPSCDGRAFHFLPPALRMLLYFYSIDIAEFAANKFADRSSLASHGIMANVQVSTANVMKDSAVKGCAESREVQ